MQLYYVEKTNKLEKIIRLTSLEIQCIIAVGATARAHYRHPFSLSDSKLLVGIPL